MAKLHHINQNIKKENYIAAIPFVTATGVEPTTAGAEIQCSIQLSYGAIAQK